MAGIHTPIDTESRETKGSSGRSFPVSFYTLLSVFFFWGFVAASNGIFIPFCKSHFHLNQFQSQLIDSAFYGAYFFGSLALWLFMNITRINFINKIGFKNGIICGLGVSTLGALLMFPAVSSENFPFILTAFFVIALGFSLQQTCAQPFVVAVGDAGSGAHRLNLAGGINSFGTLLGPVIVSYALFGKLSENATGQVNLASIQTLFGGLAVLFMVAIIMLWRTKIPTQNKQEIIADGQLSVWRFPQLVWGMLAIFIYVGTEVTIPSNLSALVEQNDFGGLAMHQTSAFVALYWGSLMMGRWSGALSAFGIRKQTYRLLLWIVPLIAFALVLGVNALRGSEVSHLWPYVFWVLVMAILMRLTNEEPRKTLVWFGIAGALCMGIGLGLKGDAAVFFLISGGLWCSIMWPCIFSLAIRGLGNKTSEGSALLIMMILGGAIIPPLQGWIGDQWSIHASYVVPLLGFLYLALYGNLPIHGKNQA